MVCGPRADVGDVLDLDTYCRLPHALVSLFGDGPSFIDGVLAGLGRERFVAARTAYLLTLPPMLAQTDLVATIPSAASSLFTDLGLRCHPPPPELGLPDTSLMLLIWHARYTASPAHAWFRSLISEAMGEPA